MVVGRSPLITRLLVWALAIVAIDGVVIVTRDDSHPPASRASQSASSASSTTTTTTSGGATESSAGDATSTTATGGDSPTTNDATTPTTVAASSCARSGEEVVAHLHGDGDTPQSASFCVEGRWQVRWQVDEGSGVAGTVNDDDADKAYAFISMEAGQNSEDFQMGCNHCTLELTPDGSAYDVLVVDVEG